MNMRLMVGGWDILPVGTKQGGELCLSHIAVLRYIWLFCLRGEISMHTRDWG